MMRNIHPIALLLCAAVAAAAEERPEPPPFETVCFDDFDDVKSYLSAEQLGLLLSPVPEQPGKISTGKITPGNRYTYTICNLTGWHRLKAPWPDDAAWRLGLNDVKELDLHFWSGREGITLRLYPAMSGTWVAYKTTRDGDGPQPQTLALWALDNGKYARSKGGTVEIRFQDGRLVLTRGDLVLLSVPFPGLPQEVYLQGSLNLRGVAMAPSAPAPLPAAVKRTAVLRMDKPADAEWQLAPAEGMQGVQFTKRPDGRVELLSAADTEGVQAITSIGKPGLYEYVFEVEDGEPGSGVFLGNERGEPIFCVGFARHEASKQTLFYPHLPNAVYAETTYNPATSAVPFAGRHQWIRVVYGAGLARCYTSGDGSYWSEMQPNPTYVSGRCATLGLYCEPAKTQRAIKLRSLEIRQLDALSALAPAELVDRAAVPEGAKTAADWLALVVQSQPADIAPRVWQRACAIRALGDNPPLPLGQAVLTWLLDDVLTAAGDWQSKLRVLDEAALLTGVANFGSLPNCPDLVALYGWLGREACRQGLETPLSTLGAAALRSPAWNIRIDPYPQNLVQCELITLTQQERWADVGRCCRWLRYFLRLGELSYRAPPWREQPETTMQLFRWSEAQAWLSAPRSPMGERPGGKGSLSRNQWRHPLAEHVSKESFNLLAEFDAAVSGGEYRGACHVISSWSIAEGGGLLPSAKDPRLLQSLAAIVESSMQNIPELRQAMREDFAPAGRLRLKQAIADGDAATVAAVALQFHGTDAAADAHLWLGDRWLSRGEAARASGHYREALPNLPAERREGLLARLRLAGAMLGRNVGEPVAAPVELAHAHFTAAQFEGLVAQLRQARQGNGQSAEVSNESAAADTTCPAPVQYEVRPWARLDAPKDVLSWSGRGTNAVVAGERLIVSNSGLQAAFDLDSGQQKWLYRPSPKVKRVSFAAATRPAVGPGGRLFACRDNDAGAELVCLDAADGRIVWTAALGSNVQVASEPLPAGRDLYVLCSTPRPDGTLGLELAALDPQTGRLQSRVALLDFVDLWAGLIPCRATLVENRIVGTAGGTAFCCDLLGRMAWARRQIWTPRPDKGGDAPLWRQQLHEPPLVAGSRVYATQPGVWGVECLDLETGRLLWRRGLIDLTGILGCTQRRLVASTLTGLLALDAGSGKTLWSHDTEDRLDVQRCGDDGSILYARLHEQDEPKRKQPVLVWVDPDTGRTTAEAALDFELKKEAAFGPLVVYGGRQWVLTAAADKATDRDVLELLPEL